MPKRKKLGTTYTRSPVQNLRGIFAGNLSKIFFTVFLSISYLAVLFVIIGIVKFLGSEIGDVWEKGTPTIQVFNSPYLLPVKIAGLVGVFFYVFKDKMTNR